MYKLGPLESTEDAVKTLPVMIAQWWISTATKAIKLPGTGQITLKSLAIQRKRRGIEGLLVEPYGGHSLIFRDSHTLSLIFRDSHTHYRRHCFFLAVSGLLPHTGRRNRIYKLLMGNGIEQISAILSFSGWWLIVSISF
uniref:Uncharacterized protein n=1 Tax=Sphaerodactylus townsendi TaxID=933632 RepID=A0ACB8GCL2_9SAUR